MSLERTKLLVLVISGGISLVIYALLTIESLTLPSLPHFVGLFFCAFFLFVLAAVVAWKKPLRGKPSTLWVICGFAVVFRLISLVGEPLFEDDMHRYLWDGKVWASGINPYFYPPDGYFVAHLRDENWEGINFKTIPTIYPPLAQMIFRISYHIAPNSAIALKGIFFLFDLGVIGLLIWMLRRLDLPVSCVMLYAWNPLVIKEFANSGHLDVVAIFFVVLFCVFSIQGLRSLSSVALGLAILAKLFPLLLLPALIRHYRLRDFTLCIGTVFLGYAPFWDAQELVFEGLGTYARHWEFNDSGFVLLRLMLSPLTDAPFVAAKGLVIAALFCLGLYLSRKAAEDHLQRLKAFFLLIGGLLLFSPTVDTWYLTWIVPFLCFFPSTSWLLLTGTSAMAYCYFWQERDFWWIRSVEYGPFYLCLVFEMYPKIRSILKDRFRLQDRAGRVAGNSLLQEERI